MVFGKAPELFDTVDVVLPPSELFEYLFFITDQGLPPHQHPINYIISYKLYAEKIKESHRVSNKVKSPNGFLICRQTAGGPG
jgi:hypothetical protein